MPRVDWLILTAANSTQARGYEEQLRWRQEQGLLPRGAEAAQWRVVADPGDRRVGSGGSTLWVLLQIARAMRKSRPDARTLADLFVDQNVLVIHSGGDSRRLCAYAAQGKIFTPLPCDGAGGQPATLFDLLAGDLAALPRPEHGSVLLAAGDVLLTFDHDEVNFNRPGVVGVAYPGPVERGSKHGVYVADAQGHVKDFLQKPSPDHARQRGAIDAVGRVLVDTGLIGLDAATVEKWLRSAGSRLGRGDVTLGNGLLSQIVSGKAPSIDLYEQMLMALPTGVTEAEYLRNVAGDGAGRKPSAATARTKAMLTSMYRGLHGSDFTVNVLPYCDFFHIGTSRELLTNVGSLSRTAKQFSFANFDRSVVGDRAALEGAFVYNSVLQTAAVRSGSGVLLEAVHTDAQVELPGRNVIVGWPKEAKLPIRLPEGWGLVALPIVGGKWSAVLFGIDDDFKTSRPDQGTLGNEPLDTVLGRHGLKPGDVWRETEPKAQTMWNARLWRVGTARQVIADVLWLTKTGRGATPPATWSKGQRVSMAELLSRVDHRRLIAHRREIQRLGDLFDLERRLAESNDLSAQRVVETLTDGDEAGVALRQVLALIDRWRDPLAQARLLWMAREIVQRFPAAQAATASARRGRAKGPRKSAKDDDSYGRLAFARIAQAVARQVELPEKPRPAAILHDQVVWATTPVRLDFAGGWSDTPPICTALGGTVVNAAITLNEQYPVQVIAKLSERPVITLTSLDLGQRIELSTTASVLDHRDPSQWSALPKAALTLSGLCPSDPDRRLDTWLGKLGGGLDLTLFSALPKGSGLGTSSILGAAMLACLARVVGETVTDDQLISRTSVLEQMMTTAGGWQDQIGGITPGIKLIRTQPGADQTPSLHWTSFGPRSDAKQRLLLYFTGQKRMARNILQRVVGRYLARDPQALAVIEQLKAGAEKMKHDLDTGDLDAFARGIEDYWTLKKRLDPGSTNPAIEKLLARVDRYVSGKVLPGAGGGGFVFMVARDADAAATIRRLLNTHRPNPQARFFDVAVDQQGLKVTVL